MLRLYKTLGSVCLIGALSLLLPACDSGSDSGSGDSKTKGSGDGDGDAGDSDKDGDDDSANADGDEDGSKGGDDDGSKSEDSGGADSSDKEDDGDSQDSDGDGDGDADADGGDDGTFVSPMDGGIVGSCDVANQDCGEGEKCTPYLSQEGGCCVDASHCQPIIDNKQLGDSCTRDPDNDDCDKGLFCMTKSSGDTGDGVCMQLCDGAEETCEKYDYPEANCEVFNGGALPMCMEPCHPLDQDCAGSLVCYATGDGFSCTRPGFEDGEGQNGDACQTLQSCQKGLACANGGFQSNCDSNCCTPFCDIESDENACTDTDEGCVPYFEEGTAPPGYANVGLCALPNEG